MCCGAPEIGPTKPHGATRDLQKCSWLPLGPQGSITTQGPPTCSIGPHRARTSFAASCCRKYTSGLSPAPTAPPPTQGPLAYVFAMPQVSAGPQAPTSPVQPYWAPLRRCPADAHRRPTRGPHPHGPHLRPSKSPARAPRPRPSCRAPKRPLLPGLTAPSFPGPFRRRHLRQHLLQDRDALPRPTSDLQRSPTPYE